MSLEFMGVRHEKLESLRKTITFWSRLHRVIHRRPAPQVERAIASGHLEIEAGRVRPTPRGMHFLNDLLVEFLP